MSSAITEIFLQPLLWTRRVEEKITLSAATFDEFLSRAKIISFRLLPYFYSEEKQLYWPRLLPCKNKGTHIWYPWCMKHTFTHFSVGIYKIPFSLFTTLWNKFINSIMTTAKKNLQFERVWNIWIIAKNQDFYSNQKSSGNYVLRFQHFWRENSNFLTI